MPFAYIATYVSYTFIIIAYVYKTLKIAKMPLHLRWELYPVPHDKGHRHGGSYFEELEWWNKPQEKKTLRGIFYLLKQYFMFSGYFRKKRGYWLSLYPWHVGFYLIVLFHILTFFGALAIVTVGINISSVSAIGLGIALYYLTLVVAVGSFILGSFGSIGMLIERLVKKELKDYASPANYFNYIFFLIVFLSGLFSWIFYDPTLSAYREFWVSLITFQYTAVEPATYAHIMIFSLFLIYLPFTRSTHYITILFAYFSVNWGDKPNLRGSEIEKDIKEMLNKPVSWSAPHIQSVKKWSDIATEGVEAE
ncbi:respiratory nitrate reductase subunit gamma [Chloroflexota bacterium]